MTIQDLIGGAASRHFVREMHSRMLGANVWAPAPMALFTFSGWNHRSVGDSRMRVIEGVMFSAPRKCGLSRREKSRVRAAGRRIRSGQQT